ncbi:hypothetical protein M8J77_003408 [Diaphorina citri]|nr:hypothetical protein M8J77_003408 [Diaphorina citri]
MHHEPVLRLSEYFMEIFVSTFDGCHATARSRGGGMTCYGEGNTSDEVQKSLELLDQVLSEFDDLEPDEGEGRCVSAPLTATSTPDEDLESPSLGHTSEDDGYMSMNGRRNKLLLNLTRNNNEPGVPPGSGGRDCPPPPEEAQRIIANLLPRVSPCNTARRPSPIHTNNNRVSMFSNHDSLDRKTNTSTQTTLPKTRHQRPYGWENGVALPPLRIEEVEPVKKFGSLPCDGLSQYRDGLSQYRDGLSQYRDGLSQYRTQGWLPPRTNPCVGEKHREVRRTMPDSLVDSLARCETTDDELGGGGGGNFSDDSLEDIPLPPTPSSTNKRHSIAWEVPLSPGSTRVVGRRRRKSATDHSSTGSISRTSQNLEEWPDPPESFPDLSLLPADLSSTGTYVIRRGRKRPPSKLGVRSPGVKRDSGLDLKRYSSTFDNIKSLLKDGKVDGLDETPPDFPPPTPPALVRGSSLPSLTSQAGPVTSGLVKRCDFLSSSLENIVDSDLDYQDSNYEYRDSSSLENMLIDRLRQSGDEFDSLDSRINEGLSSCGELDHPRLSVFDLDIPLVRDGGIQKCESHTSTTDLNTQFSSTDDIDISEPPPPPPPLSPPPVEKCDIAIQVEPMEIQLDKQQATNTQSVQVDQRLATETHTSLSCQTEGDRTQDPAPSTLEAKPEDVMAYSSESFVDKEDPEYIRTHGELTETSEVPRTNTNEETHCHDNHENERRIPTPDYPPASPPPEKIPTPDYPQAFPIPAYREKIPTPCDSQDKSPCENEKIPTPDYSRDEIDLPRVPRVESSRQKCVRGSLKLNLHSESDPPVWNGVSEIPPTQTQTVSVKETPLTARQENALSQRGTNSRENSLSSFKGNSPAGRQDSHKEGSLPGSRKNSLSHNKGSISSTSQSRQQNGGDFKVQVEVIHHEFGPLPPSPVEEDDEFHDTVHPPPSSGVGTDSPYYRVQDPSLPHASASLKTRSMDAGFSRNFRNQQHASRKDVPPERRTLPTDLPGPSRRRAGPGGFVKRGSLSPRGTPGPDSTSSLPETPLFSRCDIPRTPHRRAPDVPTMCRTAPRPGTGGTYRPGMMGHGSAIALEQAMVGAELLRMQGPGRGWYPRHRQPRPASVEHLDRLATHPAGSGTHPVPNPGVWDPKDARKPCTLPPNLSPPKFFHRGPRDALRRVTSLLIRGKGK